MNEMLATRDLIEMMTPIALAETIASIEQAGNRNDAKAFTVFWLNAALAAKVGHPEAAEMILDAHRAAQQPPTGNETMTTAQIQMNSKVAALSTAQLCETFELTNDNYDSAATIVRGAVMDELESRNMAAFSRWMKSKVVADMDKPSKFFL